MAWLKKTNEHAEPTKFDRLNNKIKIININKDDYACYIP